MKDPFGTILVAIRDYPAVAAIAGDRVSAVAEDPPSVRLRKMPTSLRPFGRGSSRTGLQLAQFIAQCYGDLSETGPIVAAQLAGAVCDALNLKAVPNGATYIARMYTPDVGEMLLDPDTRWPYHTVRIEAYAATQAVA